MTKEEIQNRIEQVAYDGATAGYNQSVIEREAKKLTTELVKLFAIPDVVCNEAEGEVEVCPGVEACDKTDGACMFYDPCNDCDLNEQT